MLPPYADLNHAPAERRSVDAVQERPRQAYGLDRDVKAIAAGDFLYRRTELLRRIIENRPVQMERLHRIIQFFGAISAI